MHRLYAATFMLLMAALAPGNVHAQDLQLGLWSGELTPPGGAPLEVMFEVRDVDGTLEITMSNPDLGPMEFTDELLEGDELRFWWNPGIRVDCTLQRQAHGGFAGSCADGQVAGIAGTLTMNPPAA